MLATSYLKESKRNQFASMNQIGVAFDGRILIAACFTCKKYSQ